MSTKRSTQLPDPIFGSADVNAVGRTLTVSAGDNLLHAFIGPLYIAMSERNWRTLFASISELEPSVEPRTYRIVFDDEARTATAEVTA